GQGEVRPHASAGPAARPRLLAAGPHLLPQRLQLRAAPPHGHLDVGDRFAAVGRDVGLRPAKGPPGRPRLTIPSEVTGMAGTTAAAAVFQGKGVIASKMMKLAKWIVVGTLLFAACSKSKSGAPSTGASPFDKRWDALQAQGTQAIAIVDEPGAALMDNVLGAQ